MSISKLAAKPVMPVVLRYALAVLSVATALGTTFLLRQYHLPRMFGSFSFIAIALSFWYAGTGPGLLAVLLSSLVMAFVFGPITEVRGPGWESFLGIYALFGALVGWFSTSRRRAERLLTEARDTLEQKVQDRTSELRRANVDLESAHAELQKEKDRLKLLLEVTNQVVSSLELYDLLRAISASIRRAMQCDCISMALPDLDGTHLRVSILDFPASKGFAREEALIPIDGSPAGKVFRSGKPIVLSGDELNQISVEIDPAMAEGYQSRCFLPVISRGVVLGTLVLGRLKQQGTVFTDDEIEFFTQVASQIAIAVENASAYRQIADLKDKLAQEKLYLEDEIRTDANFEEIVGTSPALRRVLKHVETVAPTDSTVLIYGETGTGKELIARAIHDLSPRRAKTFIRLNCAAIPTGLLESELFGHEKGAFTGAVSQRIGRMELANQGTLFLDEVGEIPLELQPKLLRVLQEREFERLGSARTLRTDVRLIAATNQDLAAMVEQQKFRSDLFFRLNVFPIQIPALRERAEDIPLLVRHFADEFSRRMNKPIETIPAETMKALCQYHWPGNVRELQNIIERAVILSTGTILNVPIADLAAHAPPAPPRQTVSAGAIRRKPVRSILQQVDRNQIIQALKDADGRVGGPTGAASRLGLKRTTFITRMKKLGIDPNLMSEPEDLGADTSDSSDTFIQ
jgi:formate hydrogenlyase transcriptional activator